MLVPMVLSKAVGWKDHAVAPSTNNLHGVYIMKDTILGCIFDMIECHQQILPFTL